MPALQYWWFRKKYIRSFKSHSCEGRNPVFSSYYGFLPSQEWHLFDFLRFRQYFSLQKAGYNTECRLCWCSGVPSQNFCFFCWQDEMTEDIIHIQQSINLSQRREDAKLFKTFFNHILCELCDSAWEKNHFSRILNCRNRSSAWTKTPLPWREGLGEGE